MAKVRRWSVLERLVHENAWTRGVELGVYRGQTLEHLMRACPGLRMTAVDTWAPGDPRIDTPAPVKKSRADGGGRAYLGDDHESHHAYVLAIADAYDGRIDVCRCTTIEASAAAPDGAFDFTFHDADHRPDQVEAEIRAWLPKLKPDGWLVGHDFDIPVLGERLSRLLPGVRVFQDSVWGIPVSEVRL